MSTSEHIPAYMLSVSDIICPSYTPEGAPDGPELEVLRVRDLDDTRVELLVLECDISHKVTITLEHDEYVEVLR